MEWLDEGLLLRIQTHGESNVIATFLTQHRGLVSGYIRLNKKYPLQQGNLYHLRSKARLISHMGLLAVEQHDAFASIMLAALTSPIKLACINAIRTLLITTLVSHDTVGDLYDRVKHHIHEICVHAQLRHYVFFEKDLLASCGFGLDLSRCAVTNSSEGLAYVSPKTGRAVTEDVGAPYKDQLLKLPSPLNSPEPKQWSHHDIEDGLALTGYFLYRMFQEHFHRNFPEERDFLVRLIQKKMKKNFV